jgi:hypothetical protein
VRGLDPHAVTVEASAGCITLGGPILAHEQEALLADVARVDGVREVREQLELHEQANGIPALQGEGHAARHGNAIQALPPSLRGVALAGGFTDRAAPNRTRIIRTHRDGRQETLVVDLNEVMKRGRKDKDVTLTPNDVIVVTESFF